MTVAEYIHDLKKAELVVFTGKILEIIANHNGDMTSLESEVENTLKELERIDNTDFRPQLEEKPF